MKIEPKMMMQAGPSMGRTRSPEAFEVAIAKAKNAVKSGLTGAASMIPVVSTLTAGAGMPGGSGSVTDMAHLQKQQQDWNMEYLKLQMEVQAENRQFSTISNIVKSRHDTARAAINNIRT